MMVGDEMFWGCDALPHLEVFLRGENVVPEHLIAHWKSLPVGVTRKR